MRKRFAKLTTYINPEIVETSKEVTFGPDAKDPILRVACLFQNSMDRCLLDLDQVSHTTPQQEVFENTL